MTVTELPIPADIIWVKPVTEFFAPCSGQDWTQRMMKMKTMGLTVPTGSILAPTEGYRPPPSYALASSIFSESLSLAGKPLPN